MNPTPNTDPNVITKVGYAARLCLYAVIAFGTALLANAAADRAPTWVEYATAALSAAVAVRAFIDKSPAQLDKNDDGAMG